jgi:hypothetical protein
MANIDAKLKVAELDFDTIKTNLKSYLKSQSEFSDYNFEGSGMSVLLDILAYNTHYMGYYLNMVSNEMFIDTALTRGSVVSHAKLLGYTPRSRIAARAAVNLTISPTAGDANASVLIPRFTRFVSETKDGVNYIFTNPSTKIVAKNTSTGLFVAENLELKEGQPVTFTFTYDSQTNPRQVFELPDVGIDTSTLEVVVQSSTQNANQETYILAQDATDVDEDALVYYLEENKNGRYQIYFGDGIIGKKISEGNIVIVTYLITSGAGANNLKDFKLLDNILTGSTTTISLVAESSSGTAEETIDQIRFTAPKSFIAQNRAVTKNDYIALINRDYPYFEAVNVWGGEENVPPVYGKVFFTAKPLGGYEITATEVEFVKNSILKPFSVLTVTPEYVAADYNYLNLVVDVNFNPTRTNRTGEEVKSLVISAIRNFANTNLDNFNNSFKVSKLSRAIDDAENSITNNDIKVYLEKRFTVDTTRMSDYILNFDTELKQGTTTERIVSSPSFGYLDSNGIERSCFIEEVLQSFTGVEKIEVLSGGSEYTSTPTVIIEGDGQGASATAIIVNGSVRSIQIANEGSGYTSATARLVGGGGSGALLRANLQGRTGTLRIYYFDSNNIKKTITNNAGRIDYRSGVITLDNFSPTFVDDPFGTMIVKAVPTSKVFNSERNRILTLDQSDPTSIISTINAVIE